MSNENETTNENTDTNMVKKLTDAGKKAEEQKAQRRQRVVKGSHLLPQLLQNAQTVDGLVVKDNSGFHKITGSAKGRSIYIAKKGGRVDLSGFTLDSEAVKQISEEEAKDKHLGKVRGQLNFDSDDETILSTYTKALASLVAEEEEISSKAE